MSDLQDKVNELEKQLEEAHKEVVVLRNAVAHLSLRLDSMPDLSGPIGGSVRAPKKQQRASITSLPRPVTALPTAPKPATPAKEEKRPATAKPAGATPAGKKPAAAAPGSAKKVPKVLAVRETEDKKETPASQSFDKSRTGKYNVGNRQIYYHIPSYFPAIADLPPPADAKTSLKLDFVYGFNGKELRNNMFWDKHNPGNLIYSVAGTGVVWNPTTNEQKHFTGHNEDILSLAVHPTKPLVATGQLDPKGSGTPFICIWDSNTAELVKTIVFHDRGIVGLGFSGDGKYLISIGNDDSHTLAVWDWENTQGNEKKKSAKEAKFTPLIEQMCSKDEMYGLEVNPKGDEKGDWVEFATYGVKHLKIWRATGLTSADKKARKLEAKIPSTYAPTKVVQKAFYGVAFLNNSEDYVVATQTGDLYRLNGINLVKHFKAHEKSIGVVKALENGGYLTAGDDAKIHIFDADNKNVDTIDVPKAHARSVAMMGDRLAVGTAKNAIVEVDMKTKETKEVMNGHFDEVWGCAVHPTEAVVLTSAHDKTLRVWDYKSKTLAKSFALKGQGRSVAFSSDGKYVAVGLSTGQVQVVDFAEWKEVLDLKVAAETVDALQFSPDNSLLACGSWDQKTHIISIPEGKKKGTLKGHTSSVLMLNFSADGKYIMTNSRDYEILYWDVAEGKRVDLTEELIDAKWQGWNCFLGWPVQGIWAGAGDGTDINMVERSHNENVLAAGDDFGKVRLYAFPAVHKDAPVKEYAGHCSHVTNVRFSPDDSLLFSCGGNDCSVFQWVHS